MGVALSQRAREMVLDEGEAGGVADDYKVDGGSEGLLGLTLPGDLDDVAYAYCLTVVCVFPHALAEAFVVEVLEVGHSFFDPFPLLFVFLSFRCT